MDSNLDVSVPLSVPRYLQKVTEYSDIFFKCKVSEYIGVAMCHA